MKSKRVRTVVCALLASGLTAALVAVGCDNTSSAPRPFPYPDGGYGSNGPIGTYDGGINTQDAPGPSYDGGSPTFDGGTPPPYDSGGF